MSAPAQAPVVYIPHGGGPMPLLGDPGHQPMVAFLTSLASRFSGVSAILVVSAHWEARSPTVLGDDQPELYFDYYGFPPQTYTYRYPASNPGLWRSRVHAVLSDAGFASDEITGRGYDHGVFVPLMLMAPEAGIPVLQVSLMDSLDPAAHIELGQALAPLRDEGVMILGSGLSFHNMRLLRGEGDQTPSQAFHDWLVPVLSDPAWREQDRYQALIDWAQAPEARTCHPREEHLLPLHVCLGAAEGKAAEIAFDGPVLGQRTIGAVWS